jgi:hypothetical protein
LRLLSFFKTSGVRADELLRGLQASMGCELALAQLSSKQVLCAQMRCLSCGLQATVGYKLTLSCFSLVVFPKQELCVLCMQYL